MVETIKADAVVVGAGLGGLSAACTLAKAGKRVVVLEHHAVPGGYAHDFRRGHYRFEVSLHALDGIAPGGLAYPAARELELWDRVKFHRLDPFYIAHFPEHEVQVSADVYTHENELIRLFPEERQGIRNLIDAIKRVFGELHRNRQDALNGVELGLSELAEHYPCLLDSMESSWEDFMSQHIENPQLKAMFSTLWGYLGMPPSNLNALAFLSVWASYHFYGAYYPEGGSMAMSRSIANLLKEHGGEIHYRHTVERIEVEDNKAVAVTTHRGLRVEADLVISNASMPTTMSKLVGEEHYSKRYKRRVKRLKPSLSSLVVYLGLDRDLTADGYDFHEIFLFEDYNLENDYESILEGDFAKSNMVLTHYTHVDTGAAPDGSSVLTLICLTPWQLFEEWHDPENIKKYQKGEEYKAFKDAAAEKMLDRAEKLIPGLRDSIKYMEVGTPLTNIRYSLNYEGAIYGAEQSMDQSLAMRPGSETPIENLWNVGAWAFIGGMSAALMSGYDVAQQVLRYSEDSK